MKIREECASEMKQRYKESLPLIYLREINVYSPVFRYDRKVK